MSQQLSLPTPNYINPVTRGYESTIIACALLSVSILVVGIRIITRIRLLRRWGVDDSLMVASLLPAIANSIMGLIWNSEIGWMHIWDYPTADISKGLRMMLTSQILFTLASTLMKLSILMFISRLLLNSQVLLRYLIYVMVSMILVQAVLFTLLQLFQCHDVSSYWSISNQRQKCIEESHLVLAAGITDIMTTPIIFTFYILSHHRLTMIVLFFIGLSMAFAGVARTHYLVTAVESWDRLWDFYPASVAESVQLFVGTIWVSMPPLEYLLTNSFRLSSAVLKSHEPESGDDLQLMFKPTIYREIYREQHPELHKSPAKSEFTDTETQPQLSPGLPSPTYPSEPLLKYYLQSFSEDSQVLTPILEESFLSQLSTTSVKTKKCLTSYRSSISSFNVAQPALCYNRTKNMSTCSNRQAIRVPTFVEQVSPPNNAKVIKDVDSDIIHDSKIKEKDVTHHRATSPKEIPATDLEAQKTNEAPNSLRLLQLSLFEFERPSDWNRDRESILSLLSDWSRLVQNYHIDNSSHSDQKSNKTESSK